MDDSSMRVHSLAAARFPRAGREDRSGQVNSTVVDSRVWREVMRITGGDPRRFQVISPMRVEITDPLPGVRII